MKVKRFLFLLLFILICCSVNAQAQDKYDKLKAGLQANFDKIQSEFAFPGATAAVLLPDNTIIKIATGYAFPEKEIKMKPEDRMFSGSTGKTYVSAVMLSLISENRLSPDDKVEKYLGDYKWFSRIPNGNELTVGMLAHHNGGLPRYIYLGGFGRDLLNYRNRVWKPEDLVSYILDAKPAHPAGEGWSYSDTDYIIIAMIIEKITGNKMYDEVARRFLKPLGLKNTEPSVSRTPAGLVQGHSGPNDILPAPEKVIQDGKYFINPQFEWAGGGFISNAPDLAKWAKALYSGKVLPDEVMRLLYSPVNMETGKPDEFGYGSGVIISDTKLGIKYGHTGLMPGYITEIGYYKEHDFSIAIQINQDNFQGQHKELGKYSLILAETTASFLKK